MLNLKDRITLLKNNTVSTQVIEIANAALSACKSTGFMDSTIAESLISDLADINDSESQKFIAREKRLVAISNLGVRESYDNIVRGDLMHYPTIKPLIESWYHAISKMPEYLIAEQFVAAVSQYSWNKELAIDLAKVNEKIKEYSEDIQLSKFMYDFKNSQSHYLTKMFEKELDEYFVNRNSANRKHLLEKINPYLFDQHIAVLQKILLVSEGGLQIEANGQVVVEKIYSPVLVKENAELFLSSGRFLKKVGKSISLVSEAELKTLPVNFTELSYFLAQPNVHVSDEKITVVSESGNKTVEIISANDKVTLKLNGKEMAYNTFTKYFMNEGVFRPSDNKVLQQVAVLYENINNVYEIDYGKRLVSKTSKGYHADVFKTEGNVCVIKVNESQKVNEFISNVNAIQTKGIILEHLRYDISESLRDLLPGETEKLNNLNIQKDELSEAIKMLNDKKDAVIAQVNANATLKSNPQVKELLEAIDTELTNLKEHTHAVNNMIKSLTVVGMFSESDFVAENAIDDFWKLPENAHKTLYFAQEDEDDSYLVGSQSLKDYKNDTYWEIEESGIKTDKEAVKRAKDLAKKNNGVYFETDDVKGVKEAEEKDADGNAKFAKPNSSDDIKRTEDTVNPLESGDVVKLKNGDMGTVQGNDGNNSVIVAMENGKSVLIPQEYLNEVEIVKKKSKENNPEIQIAKNDGAQSVKVVESNEWTGAKLVDDSGKEISNIEVKALEYTSKGANDKITIKVDGKESQTLKKFVKVTL